MKIKEKKAQLKKISIVMALLLVLSATFVLAYPIITELINPTDDFEERSFIANYSINQTPLSTYAVMNESYTRLQADSLLADTISSELTITAWVHYDGTLFSGYRILVGKPHYQQFALFMDSGDQFAMDFTASGNRHSKYISGELVDTEPQWYFVSMKYNATSGDYSGFVNDEKSSVSNTGDGVIQAGTNSIGIGAYSGEVNSYTGGIDEVRIYNRTLSDEELMEIYASGMVKNTSLSTDDLLEYWSMDNISADTLTVYSDIAGGTDLTNNGAVTFANSTNPLTDIKTNFNNVNASLLDGLILKYNFENRSVFKESDAYVADLSDNDNRGVIKNDIAWIADYGRHGGGYNFTENVTVATPFYIEMERPILSNGTENWTFSVWIKPEEYSYADSAQIINLFGNYDGWVRWSKSAERCYVNFRDPSDHTLSAGTDSCPTDEWSYLTLKREGSNFTIYVNGELKNSDTYDTGVLKGDAVTEPRIGSYALGYSSLGYLSFKGSIDELNIWNRSLSDNEILTSYYSYVDKINEDEWYVELEPVNLSIGDYTYQTCSKDNDDIEVCSTLQSISRIPPSVTVIANFTAGAKKHTVRPDFYGVNVQNPKRLIGGINIDTDCDGTSETASNTTWVQEAFLGGKNGYSRYDASLNSYYGGILASYGFEDWTNTSVGYFEASSGAGVLGWRVSESGSGYGYVSQSTDAYSGSYSLNVTSNNVSGGATFAYLSPGIQFNAGEIYNASFWLKGKSGAGYTIYLKNIDGAIGCGVKSITGTGDWQEVNIGCVATTTDDDYNIVIDSIGYQEDVLIDDWNITNNGEAFPTYWEKGDITYFQDLVEFLYDNNQRMLLIMDYMPTWLANKSNPNCDWDTGGAGTCPPGDIEIWKEINADFLSRITQNNSDYYPIIDVEIWNEPYGNLGNYSYDSVGLAEEYMKIYNASYDAIKEFSPQISVVGLSGFRNAPTLTTYFLSNMTTKMDGVSIHPYGYNTVWGDEQYNDITALLAECAVYGANCSRIINSEYAIGSVTLKNASTTESNLLWNSNWASTYTHLLNTYSNITSQAYYHWFDTVSYYNCPSRYSEYPSLWSAISEAGLDNPTPTYYAPWNQTKNFGTYCPANSDIYTSTSDDGNITTVNCRLGDMYSVAIIQRDTEERNLTLSLPDYPSATIKNLQTGESYDVVAEVAEIGIINITTVSFYGEDLQAPEINIITPDALNYTTNTINFSVILNEEGSWCGYSLDEASNITMSQESSLVKFTEEVTVGSDGVHNVTFACNDTSGNMNSSSYLVSFNTDTTNASVSFINPLNNTYSNDSNGNFTTNLTDGQGIASAILNIFDSLGNLYYTNTSIFSDPLQYTWEVITSLADGVYTWFISVFDFSGNNYITENQTLTIDTTTPLIEFLSDTETNASYLSRTNIWTNYSTSDLNDIYSFMNFNNSLVGQWRFEGNANDESGNNNDATVVGAEIISNGRFGQSYEFTEDYLLVNHSSTMNFSSIDSSWTISGWFKNKGAGGQSILEKNGGSYPFAVRIDPTTCKLNALTYNGSTGGSVLTAGSVCDDVWHNFVFMRDGVNFRLLLYLDNVLIGNNSDYARAGDFGTGDLAIGTRSVGTARYFNGSIDDLIIFNRALSTSEVQSIYNSTNTYNNFTSLDDGVYTVQASLVDQAGNLNETELRTLTIDTIQPTLNITYPLNTSYNINVTELNYTIIDENPNSCWYSRDSGATNSTSVVAGVNFTGLTSVEGTNTWILYCNDSAGNENSTSVTFFKDDINPVVSKSTPISGLSTSASQILYTYFVIDTNAIANCSLLINNTIQETNTSISNQSINHTFDFTYSPRGDFNWSIQCYDEYGNLGTTGNIEIQLTDTDAGYTEGGGGSSSGTETNETASAVLGNYTTDATNQTKNETDDIKTADPTEGWQGDAREQIGRAIDWTKYWFFEKGIIVYLGAIIAVLLITKMAFGGSKKDNQLKKFPPRRNFR